MIKRIINYLKSIKIEALLYIIVGGLTTVVNFCVFTLLVSTAGIDHNLANVIAISGSILFAYVMNKLFVFRSHCTSKSELLAEAAKFIGGRLFSMIIELGGVAFLVDVLSYNEYISKAAMQVIVVIVNYIVSKLLVFRSPRVKQIPEEKIP